ncbi:MAG: S8 family serine peptidase [Acidimicrobiia bacterium]
MRSPRRHAVVALVAVLAATLGPLLVGALPAAAAEPEWNIARIGAPASAPGVLVAVVDTGVDGAHPALAGRVERGIDLVDGTGGDPNGHGTHVAGTVAGADAGCGSIGVVPDARILPVRVLDEDGEGTADVVAEGIRRATDAGAAIINLSLGTDVVLRNVAGSGLREAIDYAWSKGAIPVLAAGNDGLVGGIVGSGYGGLPAVVVTATDHEDRVAPYATSIGSADWGMSAPGGDTSGQQGRDIRSAFPGRRCALNAGTSMAAPHVSGALAALRAAGLAPRAAVDRLLATARDLGSPGPDGTYGHGLVDLRAALRSSSPAPPPPPTTVPPAEPTPSPSATTAAPPPPDELGPTASPAPTQAPGAPSTTVTDGGPDEPAPGEDDGRTGTTEEAGGDGSPVAIADEPRDGDDGPPAGAVVAAVAALGLAGTASGVAARRLRRGG